MGCFISFGDMSTSVLWFVPYAGKHVGARIDVPYSKGEFRWFEEMRNSYMCGKVRDFGKMME